MVGEEGGGSPLDPVGLLRAMIALRDNNPSSTAKRFYALAKSQTVSGRVSRYVLENEAFTLDILVHELKIPKYTLYNVIRELESWAVIYKGYSIDMNMPGANPIMYVLAKANPTRIAEAHKFHLELRSTPIGDPVDSPLRPLVVPIVEYLIENRIIVSFGVDSCINLKDVRSHFYKEHGYFPDNLYHVSKRVIEEHGFKLIEEGS